MAPIHTKTYLATLIATVGIFIGGVYIGNYVNERRTEELKTAVDKIAVDILSYETQFELVKEASCATFDRAPLREDLDTLASRLNFMENQVGKDNPEVFRLRRYYSLLEIKDYLLAKKMNEECDKPTAFILYFYSNEETCTECRRQQYILDAIESKYEPVEIYTFDYDVDLPVVQTLVNLHNIPKTPPIIDINGKIYAPFESLEAMDAIVKPIIEPATTTEKTATSSKKSNSNSQR